MTHDPLPTVSSRRRLIGQAGWLATWLMASGLLPARSLAQTVPWNKAAFDSKGLADALKALGAAAPVESREIILTAPDIAENGAVVPMGLATSLTGVRRLLIVVENNPAPLAAVFTLTDAIEPNLSTRVKMNQSSMVYAVALMADGRTLYARKDVKVTLGGCGS